MIMTISCLEYGYMMAWLWLDVGSLQAARLLGIKLDTPLDVGSLQAARLLDIKLNMLLDVGSPIRH